MKLKWNDVKPHFEGQKVWICGLEMYWYQYVWCLLEEANLTICNSLAERLAVYNRIYAIVKIYADFCDKAFDEYSDVDIHFDELTMDEENQIVYNDLIHDSDSIQTVFDILKTRLKHEGIFYSLWITNCPDDLNHPIDTYEAYVAILSDKDYADVLNDVSVGKLPSYEWLSNYM